LGAMHYVQREREQEITRLRKENAHMRMTISQRRPSEPLTADPVVQHPETKGRRTSTGVSVPPINSRPELTGETRRWPARIYLNAGQATPIACLQTMAWACDQGDTAAMARLFVIDDEAKPKANDIYAAIPAEMRAEWKSVEAFAAAIIVHNGIQQPYPGAEVLALAKIEPISAGRVALLLPGASVSGLVFQQTAEGWKYVISAAVVGDYIAQNKSALPQAH